MAKHRIPCLQPAPSPSSEAPGSEISRALTLSGAFLAKRALWECEQHFGELKTDDFMMISVMLAGSASRLNQLSVVSDWNEGGEPPEPRILGGPAAKSKAKGGLFPFGDLFIKEGSLFLIIILASSEVLRKIMGGAVVVTLESSDEQSLAKTIQNANDPFATPNSREVPLGRARFTVFGRRASNSFLAPFYAVSYTHLTLPTKLEV